MSDYKVKNTTIKPAALHIWPHILAGILLCCLVALLWWALERREEANLQKRVKAECQRTLDIITIDINNRTQSLQRIVKRWEIRGGTPEKEFISDAQSYISDDPGYQTIEWVDKSLHVRWATSLTNNEAALPLNPALKKNWQLALKKARDQKLPALTGPFELLQGGKGLLIYLPIYVSGEFEGFVLAVVHIQQWLKHLLHRELSPDYNDNFLQIISIDDTQVYNEKGRENVTYFRYDAKAESILSGLRFSVHSRPTITFIKNNQSLLPGIVFCTGCILSLLIAVIIYLFQKERKAVSIIHMSNTALEKEARIRKQKEKELEQNRDWFQSLVANIPGITYRCSLDKDWTMLFMSDDAEKITGFPAADFINNRVRTYESIIHPEDTEYVDLRVNEAVKSGFPWEISYRIIHKDGRIRWVYENGKSVLTEDNNVDFLDGVILDITEQKQVEIYQNLSSEVLSILNEHEDFDSSLQRILNTLKKITGCDAIGMRLQKAVDFPYFLQQGFATNFLLTENSLVARDSQGAICRSPDGSPQLECTCGLVLSGQTDPSNPLFTAGGSAWTNDSFPILNLSETDDPRYHPRNICIHEGYASIALVPIRVKETIAGLLQFNFRKKGQFSLTIIQLLEGVASHIGEALLRKQEEAKQEKLLHSIGERVKELDCLYGLSKLAEKAEHNIEDILKGTVALIPPSWQYPKDTCARVLFEALSCMSPSFTETPWKLEASILLHGEQKGLIQVFYMKRFPDSYEGPFLKEERRLIDELALRLANIIEQKIGTELLATERRRLSDILEGTNVGTWEWNVQTGETIFNERWANIIGYTLKELSPASIDTWRKFTHPDDIKASDELFAKHFHKELDYYEFEARMRHKNGNWIWVLDRGKVATWTEDGKPLLMSGTHQDITERKTVENKIRLLATHDALTGLPSSQLAKDRLSQAINVAIRNNKKVSVLFLDLDGFKAVNDTFGHDAGDILLQEVAQRLKGCVREADTVARIGGDEFLIVASGIHLPENVANIAEKIIEELRSPFQIGKEKATIGVSIGISLYPDHGNNADSLVKQADTAMYSVKHAGKNNFAFA